MIQANELRINNWVQVYDTNYQIHAIMSDEYPLLNTIEFGAFSLSYNDLQPIPLTEEWLVKFGFGKGDFDHEYVDNVSLDNVVIIYNSEYGKFMIETADGSIIELNHIKYVHSLQNLYFALTGEELTIK